MFPEPSSAPAREADVERLGFLQLCADRRFHGLTMLAFESATGLLPDEYWIEARSGGAPSWAETTRAARVAYRQGAMHMGWAAHGDHCFGFPGLSDQELRRRLEGTVRRRAEDFRRARHYLLFGQSGEVDVRPVS